MRRREIRNDAKRRIRGGIVGRALRSPYQIGSELLDKRAESTRDPWHLDDLDLPYSIETHILKEELDERMNSSAHASTSSPGPRKSTGTFPAGTSHGRQRHAAKQATAPLKLTDRQLTTYIKNSHDIPELHLLWSEHALSLNHLHVAAILHRLGKCHDASKPCNSPLIRDMLMHLDDAFLFHLESYSAREVSMTLWTWGTLSHQPAAHVWAATRQAIIRGAEKSRDGVSRLLACATPQSLALLAWGMFKLCSRVRRRSLPAETTLDSRDTRLVMEEGERENDQSHPDDTLVWKAITLASRLRIKSLPPRDLANIAWAFASAGRHDVSFFNLLADAAVFRINDFTPQDLSNTAWAFATLRHPYKPLFEAVAGASCKILHAFNPQAIANVMWSFAAVRSDYAQILMEAASKEVMRRLETFQPGHLSMMAWAIARSGGRGGSRSSKKGSSIQCLSLIAGVASTRLSSFKSRDISIILWSLSWAQGQDDSTLFDVAPLELVARLNRKALSWQDKAHILWSFSSADQYNSRLFSSIAISCSSSSQLASGLMSNAAALDTIISSLATSGHYDQQLFSSAASALSKSIICTKGSIRSAHGSSNRLFLNPAQATSLLRDLATMDHVDVDACDAVIAGLLSCIHLTSQDPSTTLLNNSCLVSCLMSLAVMNHTSFNLDILHLTIKHVHATVMIHRQAAKNGEGSDLNQRLKQQRWQETLQLLQAVAWLEDQVGGALKAQHKNPSSISLKRAKEIQELLNELPRGLIERARESWRSGAKQVQVSALQQSVNLSLTALGLRPRMESITLDGMFSVDIVVPKWRGKDVALEVNGPYHYARSEANGTRLRPLGTKTLRDRFLRSRGLVVANISWLEWEEVNGDPSKTKTLLESVLNSAR